MSAASLVPAVVVVLDHRFRVTPGGGVWTDAPFTYAFWSRYRAGFDRVRVVARGVPVEAAQPGWHRADGEGVEFVMLPPYRGLRALLRSIPRIGEVLRNAVGPRDAVVMRSTYSLLTRLVVRRMRRERRPFALEVVGDPYDLFAPGSFPHPLRPLLRTVGSRSLVEFCREAAAVSYVTRDALQARYPARPEAYTTHYSSVEMPSEAFAAAPRVYSSAAGRPLRLLFVGTLEKLYKAPDVLLRAFAACIARGLELELTIVGNGLHRPELEALAGTLGIADRVRFVGRVPAGEGVRRVLDESDLFVLPSHQEGVPRAAIEAMGRGLPVIGSTVGGFPELLDPEQMVPPGDLDALAARIAAVATDPGLMTRLSAQNLARAQDYRSDVLQARRASFYRALREKTEAWAREAAISAR